MEEQKLKRFRLKGSLIELKDPTVCKLVETIITGYYGQDAIYRYMNQLKAEGVYRLEESYTYSEIPDLGIYSR